MLKYLKENIVTILVTTSITFLGTFWGIKATVNRREISYIIGEKNRIFDSQNKSSKIKVIDCDSQVINDDVYLTTFVLWNSNNTDIDSQDIYQPVKVTVTNCKKIFDYSIIKSTDSDIAKYELRPDDNDTVKSVIIHWKHLVSGSGLKVKLIYSGNSESNLKLTGHLRGNNILKEGTPFIVKNNWVVLLIFAIAGVIVFRIIGSGMFSKPTTNILNYFSDMPKYIGKLFTIVTSLIMIIFILAMIFGITFGTCKLIEIFGSIKQPIL
ncbi:hypothetical protein HZA73_03300 [candidate division TA06 bacterium]|nr:hypothetical protein [candidate division TA06 bacterium]